MTGADGCRTKAVLMAAGLGTRLRPLTDTVPKCLVPIAGRPLLDRWFEIFSEAGIRVVLINTHHLAEKVREYVVERNAEGFRVEERHEPRLLGSAGTVTATRDWAADAETVVVVYADNLSDLDLAAMLRFHESHGDPVTMLLFRARHPERCGIVQLGSSGRVSEFVEKPHAPKGDLANAGVYCVSADAYREMADLRGFDLGHDVLPAFVGRMRGFLWEGYHLDVGDHESLREAERSVRNGALRRVRDSRERDVPGAVL